MNQTLPDLVIFNANEITTLNSQFGAPRTGARMSELGIIRDGAIAVKNDKIVFIGTTDDLYKTYSLEKIGISVRDELKK